MVKPSKADSALVLLLRVGAFLCLAGWTWVHFYWEGPYGVLLWQEASHALAERLGIDWDRFVGTGADDGLVQQWIGWTGWLYLAVTILTVTAREKSDLQMVGLMGGAVLLGILAYARFVGAQRQIPMLVEHGGQVLAPVLLILVLRLGARHRLTIAAAMVAMIMTFIGHGCYALNLWPMPAKFLAMTTEILGVEHEAAITLLWWAGILDFLVCFGIFLKVSRRSCALYAAIWGFLTAIARPVAGMSLSLNYWGADLFIHEAVLRAPHYVIPLYLFLVWRRPDEIETLGEDSETGTGPDGPQTVGPSKASGLSID